MKAILTKFIPATATQPNRIKARSQDGNQITVPRDDAAINPHLYAAIMLVRKMEWGPVVLAVGGVDEGEVFVMLKPTARVIDAVNESNNSGNYNNLYYVSA